MIGSLINDRYKIVAELGEGGMATVFQADDLRLQREVAIKILHPHIAKHEEFCQRFHQEAAIAAKLVHPNIVQIYDYGTSEDGRTFIVSELIRGRDFHHLQVERLKIFKRPFPPLFCALVCEEILKALEVAHKQSFIHRDVKPDNVLVSEDGVVKLTDFGIAKNIGSSMTVAGHFLGSPVYSSPEQVQGDNVDFRSDLFSVGIILYEALTGELPFNGKNASEVMMRIVQGTYSRASTISPGIPPELDALIDKALATDREKRFSSTSRMRDSLRSYLESCGVENSRTGLEQYFLNPAAFLQSHEQPLAERVQKSSSLPHMIPEESDVKIELAGARDPRRASMTKRNLAPTRPQFARRTVVVPTRQQIYSSRNNSIPQMHHSTLILGIAVIVVAIVVGGLFLLPGEGRNSLKKHTLSRIAPQPLAATASAKPELPPITLSQSPTPETPRPTTRVTVDPTKPPIVVTPEPKKNLQTTRVLPLKKREEGTKVAMVVPTRSLAQELQPPATARPAPNMGRIALQTIPAGSTILVDGKMIGSTSGEPQIKSWEIRAGTHLLAIAPLEVSGVRYAGIEKRIYVEPGKQLSLGAVRLTPFRVLTITIGGVGVVVRVNGDPYPLNGKPLSLTLPEGRVEIRAKAANGKTLERNLNLKGENFTLNASLE